MKNRYCFFNLKKIEALFLFILITFTAQAQFYNGSKLMFGKNRVQHQTFNWTYYRDNQYDVYFYPTSKPLADYVFVKAPSIIAEVEKTLNFTSSKKIQFVVYNTQGDFRESNFAYDNDNFYNQGGITNIYGSRVYLYFDGNHNNFDKMMKAGIATVFAQQLIQGENVASNISSDYLIKIPHWFYSGLASYISDPWNSEIDAYVKNGILTKKYQRFDDLTPLEARYAAHSFWKFIVDRYGDNALPNILYTTRSSKSVERGFLYVTNTSFNELLQDWYKHYFIIYRKEIKRTLPEGEQLLQKPRKKRDYSQLTLSPDGEGFAYITNEAGQLKVWVKTAEMRTPKIIYRKGQKTEDNPDFTFPRLSWHPNGEIVGFTLEDKGRCYYYPYDLITNKLEKRILIDVEKILQWSYSNDGKLILFSGFKDGQSDIFVFSFQSRSFQNLTNDFYDDFEPQFMNNQKDIIFSSNRPVDSLSPKNMFYHEQNQTYSDIFVYHYDKKDKQLLRVTNTPHANKSNIRVIDNHTITYLSDENGINNRYIAKFDSTVTKIDTIVHYAYFATSKLLTDNAYSILEQIYNNQQNLIGEIILHDGVKRMYIAPFNSQTAVEKATNTFFKNKMEEDRLKQDAIMNLKKEQGQTLTTQRRGFQQMRKSDLIPKQIENITKQDSVTNDTIKTGIQPRLFTQGFKYISPITRNYYVQFNLNRLATQADFSFLNTSYQYFTGGTEPIYLNAGMNALFLVGINDLFENYRITGGFRVTFDFQGTEFMLSYEDLSKRIDHQIVVYRRSQKQLVGYYSIKQYSNSIFYIIKYPFDKFNSLRLTFTGRYELNVLGSTNDISLKAEDQKQFWGGVKLEYVFDSSKELYTNLWKGTKMKIFAEYEQKLQKETKNLLVLGFDVRKSVKVFRNMTWVTRLSGSTNTGSARLVYYMGGLDNWILPKFNNEYYVDRTKNYEYQTLATNMRGFEQNIRNGTSFLLFSTELRIPFVQLLAGKRVSSDFLNSMQLILFADIGTAWTGVTPYSKENGLYIRYITSGTITAVVKRQENPWITGIGTGLRVSLFGYFLRFDYAWGLLNNKIYQPKGMFLLSIGLDF